jgi:phage terminase large subunit-like protein
VDYTDVSRWVDMLVSDYEILPLKIGYDRYSSQYLIKDLKNQGYHTDDVFQGYNLTNMIYEFEAGMNDRRMLIGNNDLLKIHLLNTALYSDAESRRVKIVKISKYAHIDGVASVLDALAVRSKYFDEIGEQIENEE